VITATFIKVPPGAPVDCTDLASIVGGAAFKPLESQEEQIGSSDDLSFDLWGGVSVSPEMQYGSVGVCTRALSVALDLTGFPDLSLGATYDGGSGQASRQFVYGVLPRPGWQPPVRATPDKVNWQDGLRFGPQLGPSLNLEYSKRSLLVDSVTLLTVHLGSISTPLVVGGTPFLEASLGPELSLVLRFKPKALAEDEAEETAEDGNAETATDTISEGIAEGIEQEAAFEFAELDSSPPANVVIEIDDVAYELETVALDTLPADLDDTVLDDLVDEGALPEGIADTAAIDAEAADSIGGALLYIVERVPIADIASVAPRGTGDRSGTPTPDGSGTSLVSQRLKLAASRIRHLKPRTLRRGGFPTALIPTLVRQRLSQPVPIQARPLAVTTTTLHPGGTITVVGLHLGKQRKHDVLLILSGPGGYQATKLLHVAHGAAGAAIRVPRKLAKGTWIIAIQDLSATRATSNHTLSGQALLDLAVFTHG
jgi:hypothetical protein